uniref:PLAC domain-containing protein n=1 Tax=Amphiprion percula TaxID=161767 RepID=A0A3P8SFQ4_AMPPE
MQRFLRRRRAAATAPVQAELWEQIHHGPSSALCRPYRPPVHPTVTLCFWSQCSVDCGVGRRTRSVRCVSDQGSVVNDKESDLLLLPDENCRDRRQNCVMVVQARLCVYSYYQAACCASCTHSAQRAKRH